MFMTDISIKKMSIPPGVILCIW